MRALVACTLLALTAAKPRQVTPLNQWTTDAPQMKSRRPELPSDDNFEYRNPCFFYDGLELFESDMVLTAQQRDDRQASTNLWTSPVSFAISSGSERNRDFIMAGIQHWRDNTCIQFNEVDEDSIVPHIRFTSWPCCRSYIGKVFNSGGQDISIGYGCTGLRTVAHEIGHAMGLYHQQSRHDRDSYVTILYQNIKSGKEGNFRKRTSPNYSVPYDLTSVMHYGSDYFSKNDGDTIRVNNFLRQDLIDQRGGMSHRDKQIINAMYNCAAGCSNPPTCQNGGFVREDCTCVCPGNTAGTNCETLNGDYYGDLDCGNADMSQPGNIYTPNYPQHFPKNVVCWWVINAPVGQQVKVTFTHMKMLYRKNGTCYEAYVALRYTGDQHTNTLKACGRELNDQSFTSTNNQFIVKFRSDYGWWHQQDHKTRGFTAEVEFLDGS